MYKQEYIKMEDKSNPKSLINCLLTADKMYDIQGYNCKTKGYKWFMNDKDQDRYSMRSKPVVKVTDYALT
jgi:hypothetical protein